MTSIQNYYIGIDLGGTNIKAVAIDNKGKLFCEKNTSTESEKLPQYVIEKIISIINEFKNGPGLKEKNLNGIGIAAPGVVDMKKGITKFLPNLYTGWHDIDIVSQISRSCKSNAFLLNDVRAIALGEKMFGAGKGIDNLVCMALGTGIGGGIIINGRLYFGNEGFAGEVGHQVIDLSGPRCTCGSWGCLESLASGSALSSQAIKLVKQGATTVMRELAKNDLNKIDPLVVEKAARQGDPLAVEIYEKEAFYLGTAIANLIVILNPEMIILCGGVSKAGELLIEPIRKVLTERIFLGPDLKKLKIVRGELGDSAGGMGAAVWAMTNLSDAPQT